MEVILGLLIRHLVTAAGGYLMAKGIADAGAVEAIGGGASAAAAVAWSFWQKRKSGAL